MYGRKIRDDLRAGTPAHLYLPGPHAGVWNLEAVIASDEVCLLYTSMPEVCSANEP